MNPLSDNSAQAPATHASKSQPTGAPHAVTPANDNTCESLELSAELLESNINQLITEENGDPLSHSPNAIRACVAQAQSNPFDVLDYARLTSNPPKRATRNQSDNYLAPQYGEADPYVNPAELSMDKQQTTHSTINQSNKDELTAAALTSLGLNVQTDSASQTLEEIADFQKQLAQLESEVANQQPQLPTVEILETTEIKSGRQESRLVSSEIATDSDIGSSDQVQPPVAWFAETTSEPSSMSGKQIRPASIPIVNHETGESIFDVRDFSDAADGKIEAIPGAYEVDPDLFEFQTIEDLDPVPSSIESPNRAVARVNDAIEDQVFVAGKGDVIRIDGNDGYDHIDLACYDVKQATFSGQVIYVNDQAGSTFEIHHQNIAYVLFADGVEICLDK